VEPSADFTQADPVYEHNTPVDVSAILPALALDGVAPEACIVSVVGSPTTGISDEKIGELVGVPVSAFPLLSAQLFPSKVAQKDLVELAHPVPPHVA
jgi:hypothetical protein